MMLTKFQFQFDTATLDLVLEGLAELPYKRVAGTIEQIATVARRQAAETEAEAQAAISPAAPAAEPAVRLLDEAG